MTVVAARKFGDIIVTLSDTMLSPYRGGSKTTADILPGMLKAIVINRELSVSLAGDAQMAMEAVLEAKALADGCVPLQGILAHLLKRHRESCGERSCEFLVASHCEGATLRKIAHGQISAPLDRAWLGEPILASRFLSAPPLRVINAPDTITPEELGFVSYFTQTFLREGAQVATGVGGAPIVHLASPNGHCYQTHVFVHSWGAFSAAPDARQAEMSGETSYRGYVFDPNVRGTAVLGTYLEQAGLGWIYDPLSGRWNDPLLVRGARLYFEDKVREAASATAQLHQS